MLELGGDMSLRAFWVIIRCEYDFIRPLSCSEGPNDDTHGTVLYTVQG